MAPRRTASSIVAFNNALVSTLLSSDTQRAASASGNPPSWQRPSSTVSSIATLPLSSLAPFLDHI